ncbi:Histone-lysine N-methyltransferase ASHH1 [Linum perenne]
MDQECQAQVLPQYEHIRQNEFSHRKHKKQKEEDIAICECKFDANDPDSACSERCLNWLTSTECTPGYCPCDIHCKNQKFQKCEYAKTMLVKTEGRGWGLIADEDIKAGQFIIEYCGEVISWKVARRRSYFYESQGQQDAYIISLNASESIDATSKGSHARFINHSCQPNCETRKWNVLGEIRVGIFAKEDIPIGTELSYDYNFEWYGGAKVRCLCGAAGCSEFLGAKSRGFQEDTYLWEDDDERYSVENIPLYDSAEDEPSFKLPKITGSFSPTSDITGIDENSIAMNIKNGPEIYFETPDCNGGALDLVPVDQAVAYRVKSETSEEVNLYSQDTQQSFVPKNAMISRIRSNNACRSYQIGSRPIPNKRMKKIAGGKAKQLIEKQVDVKHVAELLSLKEAKQEVLIYEEMKNDATSQLANLYGEIRPAIEEHERDSQDSVATSVAEKWIEACCTKLKAEFDLYSSIIKNVASNPPKVQNQTQMEMDTDVKYLGM